LAWPRYAAETLRPEVGKPLQEAQQLMKSGKNKEALAKLRNSTSVSGKSANETYLIERTRARRRLSAGDYDAAAKSFEYLIGSGKLSASEKAQILEGLIGIYMRAGDLARPTPPSKAPAERARRSEAARLPDAELLQAGQRRRA
jgi:hypothetical protein